LRSTTLISVGAVEQVVGPERLGVFRIIIGPAKVECKRAARSTKPFDAF
jgi:hypothetical protein